MSASPNSATMRTIWALLLACILCATVTASPFEELMRKLRSADNEVDGLVHRQNQDQSFECLSGMACGWEVFTPVSKAREYYLSNACRCPLGSRCERYEEDLSIDAVVYKCKH